MVEHQGLFGPTQRTRRKTYLQSFYLIPSLKCTSFPPSALWLSFSHSCEKDLENFFTLSKCGWIRIQKKSLSPADDVTVGEVVRWGTVTQPPHARRGMWGQSPLIDHQRWNARYRNGKRNGHRRCGGVFLCFRSSSSEISGKKNVKGLRKWEEGEGIRSGVGSGGQTDGLEHKIPLLIPPFVFFSFLHLTVNSVESSNSPARSKDKWTVKFQGNSRFELLFFDKLNSSSSLTLNPMVTLDRQCLWGSLIQPATFLASVATKC